MKKNEYLPNWLRKKYVSRAKIKAKIEEIDNIELCSMRIPKLSTLDERLGAKIGIKYVLQSLLERRENNDSRKYEESNKKRINRKNKRIRTRK